MAGTEEIILIAVTAATTAAAKPAPFEAWAVVFMRLRASAAAFPVAVAVSIRSKINSEIAKTSICLTRLMGNRRSIL